MGLPFTSAGATKVLTKAVVRAALFSGAIVGCSSPRYAPQGPTVSSIPEPPPPAWRTEGPLSLKAKVPETPWSIRQSFQARARATYLDRSALHEDGARFLGLVAELFPDPPTPETKSGIQVARREMGWLEGLAPYPLDATFHAFAASSERLPLCARPPGETSHCWTELPAAPSAGRPPFELIESAPGIATLVIRDLTNATDPAWTKFPEVLDEVARARGIVLDLRSAAGTDPRPLLPLLERLTGRAPFRPLRAIHRRATLDPYVADYARRFVASSRDPDVWADLVGTMPPSSRASSPPPIAVVVGYGCGAACELAARSLVAYAEATLFGDVSKAGRLERDDPARFVLPRSKIEIYFEATEFLLDETVERATGPTTEWWLRVREMYDGDLATFAVRDVERRLAGRPSPRCDSFPAYADPDRLPPAVRAKLRGAGLLRVPDRPNVILTLVPAAPLSAILRFAATCMAPTSISASFGQIRLPSHSKLPELSRLVQSDLVERIDVAFEPEPEPN